MLVIGIIFLAIAIIFLVAVCVTNKKEAPMTLAGFVLGLFAVFGIDFIYEGTEPEKKEFKYPVNEYKLEYEVLTRGEQIDSTYVISKIE